MDNESRSRRRSRRKTKRVLKILLTVTILAFLVVGSGLAYLATQASNAANEAYRGLDRGEKSERRAEAIDIGQDNFSVLLLGDDARPGEERARTDAMLVATFNKEERSIVLTSIPRDSYVEIVGQGTMDKITHANAFGGIDMTIDTVEHLLDIPIDHYALVKFQGLEDIVDALGGIEVDVSFTFDFTHDGQFLQFEEGPSHLDGEHALAYARERKHPDSGGDLGRGQRQQQVIEAMIEKAASFSSIHRFDDVFDSIGDNMITDLQFGHLISLHGYASSISDIETLQFEGADFRGMDGVSYFRVDENSLLEIQNRLKEHLEYENPFPSETNPVEEPPTEPSETAPVEEPPSTEPSEPEPNYNY
ncbi:LCP family glycopolymer transferase [Shouchella shacheensis]|uniref:LCP family glycopolymer transferase n=1 Tax=Shouchella shacheensis TaxID=1649580 RepID=UPI00073FF2C8|nr:LCP family protein [Shouchella shacheensis]